jgi:RNA polymerase-binding protein DksA
MRTRLETERDRVLHAIEYLHHENPGSMQDEVDEVPLDNHLAENASITVDREIDYTLEENAGHVLRAIDEALARIDTGTFGACTSCGGQIPEARLEAMPYAARCIECQRKDERG